MFASIAMIVPEETPRTLETVLAATRMMAEGWGVPTIWPLGIPTACGGFVGITGPEDFPLKDLPCPCPHPGCFAVVWLSPEQLPPGAANLFSFDPDDGEGWKR